MSRTLPVRPAMLPAELVPRGMSLSQLIAVLRARIRLVVAVGLVVLLLSAVVSLAMTPQYRATALLQLDFDVYDPLLQRDLSPNLAESYMATQVDTVGSGRVLGEVVRQLGWLDDAERVAPLRAKVAGADTESLIAFMVDEMRKSLEIRREGDTRLVSITYEADDRMLAARVPNLIAAVFLEQHQRASTAPARASADRFGAEIEQLRQRVDEAQRALAEFRQGSGLIDLDHQLDVDGDRLIDLNRRLSDAEAEARSTRLRLNAALGSAGQADAGVLGSSTVEALKSQLSQRQAELINASARLGPQHPTRRALESEVAAIRNALEAETRRHVEALRASADAASRALAQVRAEMAAQRSRVLDTRRQSEEGARYQRDLQAAQQLYEAALRNSGNVMLVSNSNYANARLAGEATPPLTHFTPKLRVNLLLGMVVGGFLGLLAALAMELIDRRVRSREDIERELGVDVLLELGPAR